jgi:hypothetical protein
VLTLFSTPKAFHGHFGIIQTNAIRSWTLLLPRPEIILLGDDPGTAGIAKQLGLRHEPQVERNEFGTPLVSSIFSRARELASYDVLCYVNADIILMRDFVAAIEKVTQLLAGQQFLLIGRKRNVDLTELLDFERPDWDTKLRNLVKAQGRFVTSDSDYFVFPKNMYRDVPRFAIGRCYWSPWFVSEARKRDIPVIDATAVVLAVESRHDYSHAVSTGGARKLGGVEYEINRNLFKAHRYYTTMDATLRLTPSGLSKSPRARLLASRLVRAQYGVYFLAKRSLPYSWPLVLFYRATRRLWNAIEQTLFSPTS